jgi:hypothetical protein
MKQIILSTILIVSLLSLGLGATARAAQPPEDIDIDRLCLYVETKRMTYDQAQLLLNEQNWRQGVYEVQLAELCKFYDKYSK